MPAAKPWAGHRRILLDTSIWIYHLEEHPEFAQAASALMTALASGEFAGVISELTLMELLVKPLKLGRRDIADQYELILNDFPHLVLVPINRDVLVLAAALRARHGIKTPDAIILSTGIRSGATLAITNDMRWKRVTEIAVQTLQSFEPSQVHSD
jgi:predicted nucleic acid-binding protein